jgi:hypothetical protein
MANRSRSLRERPRFNANRVGPAREGRPARPEAPGPPQGVAGVTGIAPQPPSVAERLASLARARTAPISREEFLAPVTRVREAIPTRSDLTWLRKLADIMGLGPIKRTLEGEEPFPWKKK